jgi:predicted esterase
MKTNLPNLSDNKQILLSSGLNDFIVLKEQTENLYNLLSKSGANVTMKCQHSSHNLLQDDMYFMQENG